MNCAPLKFYRGLILVSPHGTLITQHKKHLIIKSKRIDSIANKPLLLIENKLGLGLIQLSLPKKINLKQFINSRRSHLITESERNAWWPLYTTLYAYVITKKQFFRNPILLEYGPGPQITIKSPNIFFQKILIGTSGLPEFTRSKNKFLSYSAQLNSLEINHTFYSMPTTLFSTNLSQYRLLYTIKVPRLITHYKQLKNVKTIWNDMYKALKPIHSQIVCFLFQFSSHFICNEQNVIKLEKLSKILGHKHLFAFEFRDRSWFDNKSVMALFKKFDWILVIVHSINMINLSNGFNPDLKSCVPDSTNVYIRLHGTTGQYVGSYGRSVLTQIKKFIYKLRPNISLIYFNNTDSADAWPNALKLKSKFNRCNTEF